MSSSLPNEILGDLNLSSEPPNEEEMQQLASQPCIYKVPQHLRRHSKNAYTPWRVSIGPYHHSDPKYEVMEKRKLDYMKALMGRGYQISRKSKQNYIEKVMELEDDARSCYAEKINLSQRKFVRLLVIDGCFVVEFLLRKIQKLANVRNEPTNSEEYSEMYRFINGIFEGHGSEQDFIFQSTRTSFEVRRDLILLENQLPYIVLKSLFDLTFEGLSEKPAFCDIVYCALRTASPAITHVLTREEIRERFEVEGEKVDHFVSFLKICCGPWHVTQVNGRGVPDSVSLPIRTDEFPCLCNLNDKDIHDFRVPSITHLVKAGVKLESCDNPLLQIQFDLKKGTLVLPVLSVWHHTETFFRNIMAYELYNHTSNSGKRSVSDFLCFMDDLINTTEDVALLVRNKIIENWLESDEAIADLFSSITKNILADYASYSVVCQNLNIFRKRFLPQCKTILKRDYFDEPRAIMYFITAVVIQTVASIIQAVASVRSNK